MGIYDLSVPIVNGTDWYNEPGTEPVDLRDVGSLEKYGWVSHELRIMVLNGTTYLETSAHMYKDGPSIEQIPPEKLLCRAFIVRLKSGQQELPAPTAPLKDFQAGKDAMLLYSGWDSRLNSPDFYSASPYFSKPLQQFILDHNPSILGGDMTSYDHPADTAMPFLRAFFSRGGMILCPLVDLGRVPQDVVTLCAAPIKLVGANAAPCRVMVWT